MIWLLSAANAAELVVCSVPYAPEELAVAIGQVTDEMADGELEQARARLLTTVERLPCLTEVVDPRRLAQFTRSLARAEHLDGKPGLAAPWATASRLAEPDLPWSYVFGEEHPFRRFIEGIEIPDPVRADARYRLSPPPGGGVFVNGELLLEPAVWPEVPTLVQVFDDQQHLVDGWWQRGPTLPSVLLTEEAVTVAPPLWWKGDGPTSARYRPILEAPPPVRPLRQR